MKLLDLTARGFLVPDGAYSFHARGTPHTAMLVTGLPGSGKTAFLRLIAAAKEALAPYGSPPGLETLLAPGQDEGQLTCHWLLSPEDAERTKLSSRQQKVIIDVGPGGFNVTAESSLREALVPLSRATTRFELFPANRRLDLERWRFPHPPLSQAIEDGRRLSSDPEKYGTLRRILHDLTLAQAASIAGALEARGVALRQAQPDLLAPYKTAVAALASDLRLTHVEVREGTALPHFVRRDGRRPTLHEISASEEQEILFAFAFAWLRLSQAVILIDSPELHMHGSLHADFFGKLLRLAAESQIIVATSSESIARSMPVEQIVNLSRPSPHHPTAKAAE